MASAASNPAHCHSDQIHGFVNHTCSVTHHWCAMMAVSAGYDVGRPFVDHLQDGQGRAQGGNFSLVGCLAAGAGDRLGLKCEVTGESVPTAMLPYCGRTLLSGLIRDLQVQSQPLPPESVSKGSQRCCPRHCMLYARQADAMVSAAFTCCAATHAQEWNLKSCILGLV